MVSKFNSTTPEQKKVAGMDREDAMKIKEQGPIPIGEYKINKLQKRTNGSSRELNSKPIPELIKLFNNNKEALKGHDFNSGTLHDLLAWGDYRYPIQPLEGTNTFGRGSFYVHGGGLPGSIGCIDLTTSMEDFSNFFEEWKRKTGNESIRISVKY